MAISHRTVPMTASRKASAQPQPLITHLRQKLSLVERTTGRAGECGACVKLGIGVIDAALGGGLACGALHEVAAARETETPCATSFALAVTTRLLSQSCRFANGRSYGCPAERMASTDRAVIWISDDLSLFENGVPYGPGLDETGVAPERLITVATPHSRDALWAMEEALRCRVVGAVLGERNSRDRSAALGGAACSQPAWTSRRMDRGVEQCGAAFRARNGF